MKFLLAPDSYKGSLSATEVADNMEAGIKSVYKQAEITKRPIGDGGEGTLAALIKANCGVLKKSTVKGPLMEPTMAKYGYFFYEEEKIGIVEMAEASGLTLLSEEKRNPYNTTTFGTGELISLLLDEDCNKIIIGLGGSATNDGGIGMAQALGIKFYDEAGDIVSNGGKELIKITNIDMSELDPRIQETEIIIASDVTNRLCGKEGASYVFGPQKGATQDIVEKLDLGLKNLAYRISEQLQLDISNVAGAGAAGGLGAGLMAFLRGKMRKGFDLIIQYTDIEEKVQMADYIMTGEGFTDEQTMYGKAPYRVMLLAKKYNKPVLCISGGVSTKVDELNNSGMDIIIGATQSPMSVNQAMETAAENVQYTTAAITRILMLKNK